MDDSTMYPFLAYVPYAAAGYCVARLADDVWPTLSSQVGSVSHYSTRHGMDGEGGPSPASASCPPSGAAPVFTRNHQLVTRTPAPGESCYDEQSGLIVGGKYDGKRPAASQVSLYEANGVRLASIHLGDNRIELATCLQHPGADADPEPCGRRPARRGQPRFRQAFCAWNRGHDPGRMERKRNRWAGGRALTYGLSAQDGAIGGVATAPYGLSAQDRAFLEQRAVAFVPALAMCGEVAVGSITQTADGRECVGRLAAYALVPNDDAQPQRWNAAKLYVQTNVQAWAGLVPVPPPMG